MVSPMDVGLGNAPFRALTWKSVFFNLLAFPIALFYFVLTAVGIALSVGLLVVVVGFFLGYAVLWLIHGMAPIEAWLVSRLLDTPIRASLPEPSGSLVERFRQMLASATTWSRVGYVPLKFVVATVGFGVSVASISSLALVTAPVFYQQDWFDLSVGSWAVDTIGEAVLAAAVGLVLTWVMLYLSFLMGRLTAMLARAMVSDPTGVAP